MIQEHTLTHTHTLRSYIDVVKLMLPLPIFDFQYEQSDEDKGSKIDASVPRAQNTAGT